MRKKSILTMPSEQVRSLLQARRCGAASEPRSRGCAEDSMDPIPYRTLCSRVQGDSTPGLEPGGFFPLQNNFH